MLVRKHGSAWRAWRSDIDDDGNGRLDYTELSTCARGLGYAGPIPELWRELNPKKKKSPRGKWLQW